MNISMAIDTTVLEERQAIPKWKNRDWPLRNLDYASPSAYLQVDVIAKVLLHRAGQKEVWVGRVTKRTDWWAELSLWGSGKTLRVPFDKRVLKKAGQVPAFRHAEFRAVCERQRKGLPAWQDDVPALVQPTTIELDDDMVSRVEAFAQARGVTFEQGLEQLIDVGLRRLRALRKWVAKARQKVSEHDKFTG